MSHATVWTRCWTVVATLGFALSLFLWGPAVMAGVWAVTTLFSGLVLVSLSTSADHEAPVAAPHWGQLVGRSVLIGAGAVAVIATAAVVPVAALALMLLAAATSPWAKDCFRAWSARNTVPARAEQSHPRPLDDVLPGRAAHSLVYCQTSVRELSEEKLCHEWRRSFLVLKGAACQSEFARVVGVRGLLLDELERRNPSALKAWLSSGARAAGGPERYLHGARECATNTNQINEEETP